MGLSAICGLWAAVFAPASAQSPTDFLVQQVCVDARDVAVFGDPYECPRSRRPLRVGEALPYTKSDRLGAQFSDSFPIRDRNGISRAVQTNVFTDSLDADPLFPGEIHFDADHAGYNIIGADRDFVFFRGTFDPGGGWQGWWTGDCELKAWPVFPSTSAAFADGEARTPGNNAPACAAPMVQHAATLEWTRFDFTFAGGQTTETLVGLHWAPEYGALEISYFTRLYGVTRWEQWQPGPDGTSEGVRRQCPDSAYAARMHGRDYYMADCRDWTIITAVPGAAGRWDPDGVSATNPDLLRWPVDPLYDSTNLLTNTRIGTTGFGGPCDDTGWRVSGPARSLRLDWVRRPEPSPFGGPGSATNKNCVRTLRATGGGSDATYGQTIAAPAPGAYRFGAMVFAASALAGPAQLDIRLIQRTRAGAVVAVETLAAPVIQRARTFQRSVDVRPGVATVEFVLAPRQAGVDYAVTGAYLAPR